MKCKFCENEIIPENGKIIWYEYGNGMEIYICDRKICLEALAEFERILNTESTTHWQQE